MTAQTDRRCAWCGAPFVANRTGRPKLYCGPLCRQNAASYLERLAGWQAELAGLEASAAGWRRLRQPVPVFLRNQIDDLEGRIAARPKVARS